MMITLPFLLAHQDSGISPYRQPPAIYRRADIGARSWPIPEPGTGGESLAAFIGQPYGYRRFLVLEPLPAAAPDQFAKLMERVRSGFGRTMSRLPMVFGVSRQTLYNWLAGETPKEEHQARLHQLAAAAEVFAELGFRPTSAMLGRNIAQGKTFLQLVADGADGKATAKKLIRIVQRNRDSSNRLDALLAGRRATPDASDFGDPAMDEHA